MFGNYVARGSFELIHFQPLTLHVLLRSGTQMFVVCIHVGRTHVQAIPRECLEGPLRSQSRIRSCQGQRWIDTLVEKFPDYVEEKKGYIQTWTYLLLQMVRTILINSLAT